MTIIHCNRCSQPFETDEVRTEKFQGQAAIRTQKWGICPHCNQTDIHWFYASDEMPAFDKTNPDRYRKFRNQWLEVN